MRDQQTQFFLDTLQNIKRQIYPEEKIEVVLDTAATPQVNALMAEMVKNISETIKYYETQLNELLGLFSTRADELIQSMETYDKELKGWIQSNMAVMKQFKMDGQANKEIKKWDDAIKNLKSKIAHFKKG